MAGDFDNGSLWFDSLDIGPPAEPGALPDATDVAIVGAGFTGLWSAYYLAKLDPSLSITVFEANTVGFGASGRNGGWCMGWAMGIEAMLSRESRRDEGLRIARNMQDTVDEIGRVCQAENIDCHYAKGGTLTVATTPFHAEALAASVDHYRAVGLATEDFEWLAPDEARRRINMQPNFGAIFTPHCAAIHPARLVRGLGDVVRRNGVTIAERTPVEALEPGAVKTPRGTVRAGVILRATEAYTGTIKGQARQLLPIYSKMVATEPLPDSVWDEIGIANRETFGDARRVTIYGQRTLDNRMAFGGRAGYRYGSGILPVVPGDDPDLANVEATLKSLFPVLRDRQVTHRWGGVLGVPRHWRPFVTFDESTRVGAAGGYTGEGVGASNLAARILVDLVLGRSTDLATLAWVGDVPRRWEPEPLRWLGASAIQWFGDRADRHELATGRPSRLWGNLFNAFVG